jgi:cytochrome c oxidase subunit 3
MSTRLEGRPVFRGRRERPGDRLPVNETGLESHPGRFSLGMWAVILFISSESMFFGALFTTYFFLHARIPAWQPVIQRCFEECEKPHWNALTHIGGFTLPLVAINTVALVSSSVTMQLAVNAIKRGDAAGLRKWLIPTVVLGVWFISGQGYEYLHLGFLPDNSIFAAVFFTLTGFHGAHVTGGILMNALVLFRSFKGHFNARHHLAVEAASIYWHFVDVVWIGLFTVIYIIG